MLGGVSTVAAIPLHGFLPVDSVGWWHVGPDVLEDVTIGPRKVIVSDDPGLACPSSLLVPILLVGPHMEGGGAA